MRDYIDKPNLGFERLEQRLREGLRQEAESLQPEAQVFWTNIAHKLSNGRRAKGQSKHA